MSAGATNGKMSQLERLVFSENFVKEESEAEVGVARGRGACLDQSDKQTLFSRHFGQVQRRNYVYVNPSTNISG